MTKLSVSAQQAFNTLVDKHHVYMITKANLEAEMKAKLADALSVYRIERDVALRVANDAGVPRTQLGKAIGTTNYKTVQDILGATASTYKVKVKSTAYTLLAMDNDTWSLELFKVGAGNFTGSAMIKLVDGNLDHVSGDLAVVPNVYRNGFAEEIISIMSGA